MNHSADDLPVIPEPSATVPSGPVGAVADVAADPPLVRVRPTQARDVTSTLRSIAPLLAAGVLLIGVTGTERSITVLCIIAAVLTAVAGVVVLRIRSIR
jgi:hypothetical protein